MLLFRISLRIFDIWIQQLARLRKRVLIKSSLHQVKIEGKLQPLAQMSSTLTMYNEHFFFWSSSKVLLTLLLPGHIWRFSLWTWKCCKDLDSLPKIHNLHDNQRLFWWKGSITIFLWGFFCKAQALLANRCNRWQRWILVVVSLVY